MLSVSTAPRYSGTLGVTQPTQPTISSVGPNNGGTQDTWNPQGNNYNPQAGGFAVASGNNGGVATPTVDHTYDQWGGKSGYDQARGDWGASRDSTMGSINTGIDNNAIEYHSGILDFISGLDKARRGITGKAVANEQNRIVGKRGVLDMVGTGLKSAGVTLSNKNSSHSSAGEAFADAYSKVGQREMGKVGNQYEMGNNEINNLELDFQDQQATGMRKIGESKNVRVNNIITDAADAIGRLNAAAAGASLPDRINIENEKNRIRGEATARLQAFDSELTAGTQRNGAVGRDANRATATTNANAGLTTDNPFNYTTETPAQFQNTGPFASELPIFTMPGSRRQKW